MACVRCCSSAKRRDGHTQLGGQRWRCSDCRRRFTSRSTSAFSRHDSPDDVIALAVRWYARYRLSYADVVEWLAERGVSVDCSTVYRWVQCFLPRFGDAARAYRDAVGGRWHVDETSCRLNGKRAYLYWAIDQDGQVVDVFFSTQRNAAAARALFARAIATAGARPTRVTTDNAQWALTIVW